MTPAPPFPRPVGLSAHSSSQRFLRFWSTHLLLLNVALCSLVWLLYGSLHLGGGWGEEYMARAADFWLTEGWSRYASKPGIENVLLPGLVAAFEAIRAGIGLGSELTESVFVIYTAIPYALFIYGLTTYVRRHSHGGRLLAFAAAITLYTSGMIPYMTSWGGSVDGLTYLLMLPVFIRPESFPIYAVVLVLQCLNHYAGVISLVLFAFVWHALRALDRDDGREAITHWLIAFAPRAILSGIVLLGFMWFWDANYPDAAQVRQAIMVGKWQEPASVLQQVIGWFPWTLLSPLKLAIVPVAVLMFAPLPRQGLRTVALGTPLVAAAALTLLFVDVTRMAMMLVMPAWLVTIHAAGGGIALPPGWGRRLRRLVIGTALLNLLIPNYYVNNDNIVVPPSEVIRTVIAILTDTGE